MNKTQTNRSSEQMTVADVNDYEGGKTENVCRIWLSVKLPLFEELSGTRYGNASPRWRFQAKLPFIAIVFIAANTVVNSSVTMMESITKVSRNNPRNTFSCLWKRSIKSRPVVAKAKVRGDRGGDGTGVECLKPEGIPSNNDPSGFSTTTRFASASDECSDDVAPPPFSVAFNFLIGDADSLRRGVTRFKFESGLDDRRSDSCAARDK